jgi:hypothetical protein
MGLHIYAPLWDLPDKHSRQSPWRNLSQEQTILQLFACPNAAVAPLRRCFDGGCDEGVYLCADPVYLHPDRHCLRLFDAPHLAIELAEAAAVVQGLNQLYRAEGWQFSAPTAERWYLQLTDLPKISTYSLSEVKGDDLRHWLPKGQECLFWQQRWNEIQMFLHQHPVNDQRQARGLKPINSLWFWGAGRLPDKPPPSHWTAVFAADALSLGLAQWQGLPYQTIDMDRILQTAPNSPALLWIDLSYRDRVFVQNLLAHSVATTVIDGQRRLSWPPSRWQQWRQTLRGFL